MDMYYQLFKKEIEVLGVYVFTTRLYIYLKFVGHSEREALKKSIRTIHF